MAMGTKPRLATRAVMSLGRRRVRVPSTTASRSSRPSAAELVDVADEHDAVQDGDAAQGDEADGGADGEGHAAQMQRKDAARDGERHAHEDERGLPERAEAEEDEHEDQGERERHDDHEAGLGFLQVLELAAELEVVAVGELHLLMDGLCGLLHEAFGVASAHVDEDADAALRIFAGDLHGLGTSTILATWPSASIPPSSVRRARRLMPSRSLRRSSPKRTTMGLRRLPSMTGRPRFRRARSR
jgi:hypothetical protein